MAFMGLGRSQISQQNIMINKHKIVVCCFLDCQLPKQGILKVIQIGELFSLADLLAL